MINKVKVEMESRILDLTTDVNHRISELSSATQSSCQENAKIIDNNTSKLVNMHNAHESRFNKMERELLRNELIITGVPTTYGESVMDIIGDICNTLQCNVNGGDVVAAYRLPAGKAKSGRFHSERITAPIILKLVNDWAKQTLLSAYFKLKNLNTGVIGYQTKSRIYINESLTINNRSIFKAATEAKKSKLITKCYTRNGIVHIQISHEGKIFRISDIDQLNAIISPHSSHHQTSAFSSNSNSSQQAARTQTITASTTVPQSQTATKPDVTTAMHDVACMQFLVSYRYLLQANPKILIKLLVTL